MVSFNKSVTRDAKVFYSEYLVKCFDCNLSKLEPYHATLFLNDLANHITCHLLNQCVIWINNCSISNYRRRDKWYTVSLRTCGWFHLKSWKTSSYNFLRSLWRFTTKPPFLWHCMINFKDVKYSERYGIEHNIPKLHFVGQRSNSLTGSAVSQLNIESVIKSCCLLSRYWWSCISK